MGVNRMIDFFGGNEKSQMFVPVSARSSNIRSPTAKGKQPYAGPGSENDIEEYAQNLFQESLPLREPHKASPTLQPQECCPAAALELCTQIGIQLSIGSSEQATFGMTTQGVERQESVEASWAPNSGEPSTEPQAEPDSNTSVQEGTKFINSSSLPQTESPVVQWIIARLEDWQQHLNNLPIASTASRHLYNIAVALSQLEEEIVLIKANLLQNTAEADLEDSVEVVSKSNEEEDDSSVEDSKVDSQSLIVHVSSNTFVFSFQQLTSYMDEMPAWYLGTVLPGSIVFWHHKKDELGLFMEKPDACASLPHTNISELTCDEAYKFVNTVNKVEGRTVFRVQIVLVREQISSRLSE